MKGTSSDIFVEGVRREKPDYCLGVEMRKKKGDPVKDCQTLSISFINNLELLVSKCTVRKRGFDPINLRSLRPLFIYFDSLNPSNLLKVF